MNSAHLHSLESAAFAAWPAIDEENLLGWNLRFSGGYTKRANSANALPHAVDLSPEQIALVERRYRERGLRPIFRLTSFAVPAQLDDRLQAAGYAHVDRTLVMQMPVPATPSARLPTFEPNARTWLAAFQQASGKHGADQAIHLLMLERIKFPCAFARLADSIDWACCGLGVLVGEQLGLFDIVTAVSHQRQGLARQLCDGLIAWGYDQGARSAFLQVATSNSAAIALYQSMGFARVYDYWYRVAPC